MSLQQGTVVAGRYEIITPIKAGGMGAVYKAYDLHFRKNIVALKEMLQEFSSEETRELVKRKFEEEANILVSLNHHGIPRVSDHFIDKDVYYIVMDFIEGINLDKLLEEYMGLTGKPVRQDLVVHYAIQICDILEYIHGMKPHPIIHRDIKPGNIILRKLKQEVILVDFGLARSIDTDSSGEKTLVGTVGYSPLEQFKGQPEPRSDIYALGATMHHLVSGARPTPFCLEPVEKLFPAIDPRLAEIINRATAEEVEDRYADAAEMNEAMKSLRGLLEKDVTPEQVSGDKDLRAERETEKMASTATRRESSRTAAMEQPIEPEAKSTIYDTRNLPPKVEPLWKHRYVFYVIAALVFLLLLHVIRDNFVSPDYSMFKNSRQASRVWKFITASRYQRDGSSRNLLTFGSGDESENKGFICVRNKRPGDSGQNEMRCTLMLKGNPVFTIFFGPLGVEFRDNVESNSYGLTMQMIPAPPARPDRHFLASFRYQNIDSTEKREIGFDRMAGEQKLLLTLRNGPEGKTIFSLRLGEGDVISATEIDVPSACMTFGLFIPSAQKEGRVTIGNVEILP